MSANLGFFAEDRERDFPELNKCPDCETFFADANCPLCGKECPEEFRAGNRKPVKQKKYRRPSGNGRVQFVPWYHTVWFIVLMLFVQPVVGLILTWSGVWKTHWKIIVTVLVILPYLLMAFFGIYSAITEQLHTREIPINLESTDDEYRASCTKPDAEALYRNSNDYVGNYVNMELNVAEVTNTYYYNADNVCMDAKVYLCYIEQDERTLEFFVADYRQQDQIRLAIGDKIAVWGEVAGEIESSVNGGNLSSRPGIYARFIDLK